jgi:hypothetical protein
MIAFGEPEGCNSSRAGVKTSITLDRQRIEMEAHAVPLRHGMCERF